MADNGEGSSTRTDNSVRRPGKDISRARGSAGAADSIRRRKNARHRQAVKELEGRNREAASAAADASLVYNTEQGGFLEAEGLEKTYAFTQGAITSAVDINTARKRFELELTDFGPYDIDYTRNGKYLLIGGKRGHVGLLDWQAGKLATELHLGETVRAVKFLQNQMSFAVAQKRFVYMYDRDGVELHRMNKHVEANALEYLPYHWLLASIGNQGCLRYQDISTGQLVSELKTKAGSCQSMTTNSANAVIHTAHFNGTVQLWAPLASSPLVRALVHQGPVNDVAVDQSGKYMVSSGMDGRCKVWDLRMWKTLREWKTATPVKRISISQKGLVAVAWGSHINIWKNCFAGDMEKAPYLNHHIPASPISAVRFCPFEDILGIGQSKGVSSIIVPGSGEPNYDSLEIGLNPYATKTARREEEVKSLLGKLQPNMITLDGSFIGKVDRGKGDQKRGDLTMPSSTIQDDTSKGKEQKEIREKRRMRGKNSSLNRFLRKQSKIHIIDEKSERRKADMEREQTRADVQTSREASPSEAHEYNPLDRFKRKRQA